MTTTTKAFKVKNGLIAEGGASVTTGSLNLAAGTTTYAPLVLTSGTNLTTASAGAFEYDGTNFYLTPSSTRKTIAFTDSTLTSSVYLGTTSVALNRSSGSLSLAGVSIDGSAGSVANSLTITINGLAVEGTSKYTFNGSAAKTLDITAGSNITLTPSAGGLQISTSAGVGTVTSVSVATANGFAGTVANSTTTPAITVKTTVDGLLTGNSTTGAISAASAGYGDTTNPYGSKTANYFLAAPNGSSGSPTFRAIVAADIPTLNQNTTGSAGSVANALTIGTGLSGTAGTYNGSAAVTISLPSVGTAGTYTKVTTDAQGRVSSGTTLSASDIPTLGNITNAGAIGSTAGLMIKTTTSGVLTALAAGTSGQYLQYDGTWTTPPNYYPTAVTYAGGTTAGPVATIAMSGTSNITADAIPAASATASGVITTTTQTLAGAKTFSGNATFNGTVTLSADPVSAMQAATKQYVDGVAQGVNVHDAVQYATTTTIAGTYAAGSAGGDGGTGVGATITYTSTGTTTIDGGSTLVLNDRILVKDGVTADSGTGSKANGIYYVTTAGATGVATVLTRALDYDNSIAGDAMTGDLVYVVGGSANGGIQFLMNVTGTATTPNKGIKIGTDPITFTQFSGATSTLAGAGLVATGNVFAVGAGTGITVGTDSVSFDTTAAINTAITGVGTLTSGTWNAGVIAGQYGGTGVANTGKTITVSGNTTIGSSTNTVAFTTSGNTSVALPTTGTLATLAGSEAFTNKTYNGLTVTSSTGTLTVANGSTLATSGANSLTLTTSATTNATFPTGTITLVDLASSQALTNKTISGLTVSTTTGTLTIANGKTLTASNTLTFTGTDSSSVAFGTGGTVAYTGGKLSQFAATSSSELAGVISDETGSGALVFGTQPTLASPTSTGTYGATPVAAVKIDSTAGMITGSNSGSVAFKFSNLFAIGTYNGGEFTVKMSNGTDFEIIRLLVVIKGSTFYVTQYGDVQSNTTIGTVDFEFDATNTNNINMVITPASGTVTARMVGTLLAV